MSWDFDNDRPIYLQLVEHIQRKILSGEYPPGERLRSIRDLASEAAVNPNTMQRALAELENMGLIYSKRTAGRFITNDDDKIAQIREKYARQIVLGCVDSLNSLGYSGSHMIDMVKSILEEEDK